MLFSVSSALLLQTIYWMLRITPPSTSFPKPLTAKEEADCLEKLAQGDLAARNLLIERNLRLVVHIVKKYYASSVDQEDLISIGTIGLIKGINSFNPVKNTKLSTYAARCIENEILMHFRAAKKNANEISLSEPIDTDKDGNALALMDIICCEDHNLEKIEQMENIQKMQAYLHTCLTPREREILIARYGLYQTDPIPQRILAKQYGISRSYVSRIEKKAIEKLASAFGH
jgi:RNA polymerase sporulation-specific sigma factor